MQEEAKNEGTRSKGIFSSNYLNLGGGGGGGGYGRGSPQYPPAGYPTQHESSYSQHASSHMQQGPSYPHHGYPPPPPPPPTTYPSYGYPQPSYPSPAPVPAYSYPYTYGHAPYGHAGKHQQQHLDYYHHHQEFNMYHDGSYAPNNHGHGYGYRYDRHHHRYGMSREVPDDAKV